MIDGIDISNIVNTFLFVIVFNSRFNLSSVIAQEEYNKVPILNGNSLKNKTVNLLLEIAAGHCKQIIEF